MYVDESILNPESVFELPERDETHKVDREALADDWINQLCERLNGLSDETHITRGLLSKHLDGTYTYKSSLLDSLAYIYAALLKVTETKPISEAVKSRYTIITLRLVDEIQNCTPGFHNRVNSVVFSLQGNGESINEMLYDLRMSLVEKAAQKTSSDVHVFNRFYFVANAVGLGVLPISKDDPYRGSVSDADIQEKLQNIFLAEYDAFSIIYYLIERIQNKLRAQGRYQGLKESGYPQADYEAWMTYLQNLIGPEFKVGYDLLLMDEEEGNPIDINRGTLFSLLESYLVAHNMMKSSLNLTIADLNLMIAIRLFDERLIKLAIEEKINPSLLFMRDKTPLLIWAINEKKIALALALIEKGYQLEEKDKNDSTPLIRAVMHGRLKIALALVQKGVNINAKDKYGTNAITRAVRWANSEFAIYLIENGANVNERNEDGQTALCEAVYWRREKAAIALIENNAKLDEKGRDGNTALMLAVKKKQKKIVIALINKGASLDIKNKAGETVLTFAEKEENHQLLEILKNIIKDNNAPQNVSLLFKEGKTPLDEKEDGPCSRFRNPL